jgi:hypothetical protein
MTRDRGWIRVPRGTLALVCVLVLGLARSAIAQGLEIGARGGVNFSKIDIEGENGPSFDWRTGLVAGAFVTWPVFSWLELQPEILYTSKGAKFEEEGISAKLLLDYVEVPVLARFSGQRSGTRRFYMAAGPAFGLRVSARTRTEFSGSTEEIDISDDVERSDLGVVVAGGYETGRLVIDGRYTFGLSDIDKDTSDDVKVKNRVISVSAGIRF